MLKKYFLSNILFILIVNFLVKPIWIFGIDRNVQLKVGHESYGLYTALLSMTILFGILLDLGITNFNNKEISGDRGKIHTSLPNLLVAKLILSSLYLLVLFIIGYVLQYSPSAINLLLMLGFSQVLSSFILYLRSNISAHHDFKTDAFFSVIDKIFMIVMCGYFLFLASNRASFSILWFVKTQILSYIITLIIAIIYIHNQYIKINFLNVSLKNVLLLTKKSLPYALLIFLMGIYMRGDTVILERLAGPNETGIYANAFRILDVANMLGVLFAGMLLSMFARMIAQNGNVAELITLSSNLLLPVAFALTTFCVAYSPEIMTLLYHDNSAHLSQLFSLVMASFPAYCLMYIYSTLLTANNNIWLLVKISIVGCILCLVGNFILVPKILGIGTAITAILVHWSLALTYIIICINKFHLKADIKRLWQMLAFTILFFVINYTLHHFQIQLIIAIVINIICFLLAVFLVGFWKKATIQQYLKQYI